MLTREDRKQTRGHGIAWAHVAIVATVAGLWLACLQRHEDESITIEGFKSLSAAARQIPRPCADGSGGPGTPSRGRARQRRDGPMGCSILLYVWSSDMPLSGPALPDLEAAAAALDLAVVVVSAEDLYGSLPSGQGDSRSTIRLLSGLLGGYGAERGWPGGD